MSGIADRVFETREVLPFPRERVFAFFCTPDHLEAITPPWLRFRIVERSAPEPAEGVEYAYRLRIRGIPVRWRSRIEEWRPGERFVDVQLRGPYAKWHHTHTFRDHDGGTLVEDRVLYRLPFGLLGDRLGARYVASELEEIFAYRAARTATLLREGAG